KFMILSGVALLAWGCKDGGTGPRVATAVALSPGAVSLDAVGATQVVHAAVTDQKGKTMGGAALAWSSSSPGVTVAGAGGDSAIVTAVANGSATITATSGGASGTVTVQVAQVATNLQKAGGDGQTGAAGVALGTPLQVAVRDRLGAPVAGVTVSFSVVGGGATAASSAVSGANGIAATAWTLGTQAGSTQLATASSGSMIPAQFTATAVAGPAVAAIAAAGDDQVAAQGTAVAVAPRVLVRDQFQNPVSGVTVQFAATTGGGSVTGATQTTDANGLAVVGSWVMGPAAGINTLVATFPGTVVPAVLFTATAGNAGTISINGGNNQAAMVGTAVPTAPSVLVVDGSGNPMAGQTVTFTVTAGGGSLGSVTATTSASGVASAGSWVLGPTAGPNTLTASVAGLAAAPVSFRGTGCAGAGAGYKLTLCFTTSMTASQRAAFENAAARWATVITGDLPDESGEVPAGSCGSGSPRMDMNYDDLLIFAGIEHIDGPGAVLGSAGPCFVRTGSFHPVIGIMRFDVADVERLEQQGSFGFVILHEMGHVLGVGTIWNAKGLLQNPSTASLIRDTHFSGASAIAAFDAIGGSTYTGGAKVPVENTGGPGTANGHWRETILGRELMTGFLNAGTNPLSLLTVRSLTDVGYTVDASAADAFSVTLTDGAAIGSLRLHNDIYNGPLYTIDRRGRLNRIRN
ncbi:MAG TPA: leishmanolysin-related zinc metalloendopeptidase, partial [Longimicrobium sp.]|nr:leishmanolysin-related zinc metalloendopeptidase [Longimicrobium sp.]